MSSLLLWYLCSSANEYWCCGPRLNWYDTGRHASTNDWWKYMGHIWRHQNSIFVISPEFWEILRQNIRKSGKLRKFFWTHGKMWDIFGAGRALLLLLSNPSNLVVDPVVCDVTYITFYVHQGVSEVFSFLYFWKKKVGFPRTVVVDYISIMPTSSVGRPREGVN